MRSLMFGENEVRFSTAAHLVGDRFERVAQYFERDRIDCIREPRRIVHRPILMPWGLMP